MRYCNLLPSKLCYRLKHKLAEKKVVGVVRSGSKLRNKVFALMDYNLPDLIGNGSGKMKSETSLKDALDDLDISLICKRFPSITLGSAPQVDLYDGTTYCEKTNSSAAENFEHYFSDSSETRWVQNTLTDAWPSLYVNHSSLTSSTLRKEDSCPLPPHPMPSIYEDKLDQVTTEDSQLKVGMKSQSNLTLSELFFDKSVTFIPGLSKRQYRQLDDCGFHTLRKLLYHYPRSYANLQNAHAKIDDGQYLIFVGKVISSRGVKANCSFSFLEVVVSCQIAESEYASEHITGDAIDVQEKTIYLHLKKFFRGSRFTFKPFLKSLAEKYQEGHIACVSGKVRTMRAKDHYEMREYNIDVLEAGKDLSFFAKERPYPIYPSKGGLKPTFLGDIIARVLQALPINVDPIPKDITEQFGLLSLRDAYFGIHKPKDINEADLARKRLIFDEFFYLQLGRLFQMLEGLGTQIEKDGLLDKYRRTEDNAVCTEEWSSLTKEVLVVLPYTLTSSQLRAVSEIIWDLKRPVPMNRLLQGDVGCGKTVVAFLACMEVIGSGYQIHSKKRNRLDRQRLHNLVYVKYNQALLRRHNLKDETDPIYLNEIDECNEWLVGEMDGGDDEVDDERVFEGDDSLLWRDIYRISAIGKRRVNTRQKKKRKQSTSTSRVSKRGKGRGRGSASSSRKGKEQVVEEVEEEEEPKLEDDDDTEEELKDIDMDFDGPSDGKEAEGFVSIPNKEDDYIEDEGEEEGEDD